MAYFNEELNSMLHKRQEGNTNNAKSQPFPELSPSSNNNSTVPATKVQNSGGINKVQLIGIMAGALVILGLVVGIFLFVRKKLIRNRGARRNVIRINDVEWNNNNSSTEKFTRALPPQQLRVYNQQDIENDKLSPRMVVQNSPLNSPQYSNYSNSSRDLDDSSTINISSPLEFTPTKSEFSLTDKQRRFQQPQKGPYQHLPRSPRSPLVFKTKTTTDTDSDEDTLEGTPRSPYFFKSEPSINDQDTLRDPPRSPYSYKGEPVPAANTNNQDSSYQDELDNHLPVPPTVDNNNYNYNEDENYNNYGENIMVDNNNYNNNNYNNYEEENNNVSYDVDNNNNYNYEKENNNSGYDENISKYSNLDKNDIIMQLDSDLDNIITSLKNGQDDIYLNEQYKQSTNTNDLSSTYLKNDDTLALSLPSPFKLSWTKDSSYLNNNLSTPINEEELNRPHSQTNSSIYSESRSNSIGINENVHMDYVEPTQGIIQIEMMDDHIIIPKQSIDTNVHHTQEPEFEFDSPQSEYMAIEYMPPQQEMMQTIEPIENEFIESNQTNMNTSIITKTTRPEILASEPAVVPVSSIPTSPMYDLDVIKRHAEKVLKAKTTKNEDNKIRENDKNDESSNKETETQEKPLVRKKSVRFRASLDNGETQEVSDSAARKSILKNNESRSESDDDYESEDEEANNRDSASSSSSYQMYDFDISSYQDNTGPAYI